ncbi:MAG: hypothetical protein IPJ13_08385 [Saprospiraceae bacterium]|nr:hypothetical protein [Saprospiraceae bacterium]
MDNAKGTATVQYNGETIELTTDNPASGMSYKNDHYHSMRETEYVESSKDGNLIFSCVRIHPVCRIVIRHERTNSRRSTILNKMWCTNK